MEWSGSATLVQAVRAHRGEVACLDACGARLASGGGDRALHLWRWAPCGGWERAAEACAAHRYGVTVVRWSGGGALLASGGVDGTARVWCGRTLGARRTLAAPGAAAVRALCWAGGGGARLVTGHDDGAVCVWAATRGALLARFAAHEGALHALAIPARETLLLTACTDGVLKIFDLAAICNASGEGCGGAAPAPLFWVDGAHDMGALCADTDEEGTAATGGHDARICLWRVGPGSAPLVAAGVLEGHTAAVTALRWARGGSGGVEGAVLASASLDRTARLWAPPASACLLVVQAHPRYLTCVAVAPDLRYMITGSNDKSFRMWSLGSFSLEDELEPPCAVLTHFGLGDLEGIGPVEEDEGSSGSGDTQAEGTVQGEGGSGARHVWSAQAHASAINCIATCGDLLATASSDGSVKVWRWVAHQEETARAEGACGGALVLEHTLLEHRYPVLAADFGASGAVLLTAGLDGCAVVWDVQSGVVLRSLVVPGGGGAGGETGGGGVRAARVSPHRAPLLLLATDDGLAPLWALTDPDPHPIHVYTGHTEAVTCCAWSADGRVVATGAASGALRLAAPPEPGCLYHASQAHDLGVLSCDFAPPSSSLELPEGSYLLATGGCDSLVKLWRIDLREEGSGADVRLVQQVAAHGGAVAGVQWGAARGALVLVTAGEDAWARVWRVAHNVRGTRLWEECAVPVQGAGGARAAAPAAGASLLAVGSLGGELTLWRLEPAEARAVDDATGDDDDGAAPRFWGEAGVARWLREYAAYAPDSCAAPTVAMLQDRARAARLTGAHLLDDPVEDLLLIFGFGEESEADAAAAEHARVELQWLRAMPPPRLLEAQAPHALLCPLSHRLLAWPARAADGFSYERANLLEWLRAAPPEGATSPLSGRRLRSALVAPNYALRDTLHAFLRGAAGAGTDTDATASDVDDAPPEE